MRRNRRRTFSLPPRYLSKKKEYCKKALGQRGCQPTSEHESPEVAVVEIQLIISLLLLSISLLLSSVLLPVSQENDMSPVAIVGSGGGGGRGHSSAAAAAASDAHNPPQNVPYPVAAAVAAAAGGWTRDGSLDGVL